LGAGCFVKRGSGRKEKGDKERGERKEGGECPSSERRGGCS